MGYTKLFNEICLSTIWAQPDAVRILWITMLAIKDERHEVMASVPGLAKIANISRQDCEDALKILSNPDTDSRSQDFKGRRIEACDGGWKILNGEKYRRKLAHENKKEYQKEWVKEKRRFVSTHVANVDDVDTTEQNITKQNKTEQNKEKNKNIALFWESYLGRNGMKGSKKKAFEEWNKLTLNEHNLALSALSKQKEFHEKAKTSGVFVAEFPDAWRWLRDKRFLDEIGEIKKEDWSVGAERELKAKGIL